MTAPEAQRHLDAIEAAMKALGSGPATSVGDLRSVVEALAAAVNGLLTDAKQATGARHGSMR